MTSFELAPTLSLLTSGRDEKFLHEWEIRLFQFQTWIYFSNDYQMVDAAGRLAAAAFLRDRELQVGKKLPGMGRGMAIDSKILIGLLKERDYGNLYNAIFEEGGWTALARTITTKAFDGKVKDRLRVTETICEMIDFRFRGLDHGTLDAKQSNISRSEFYRWYRHHNGSLSWRTIRDRWKDNRSSAPFLYVSEKLGFHMRPITLGMQSPSRALRMSTISASHIKKFIQTSMYVASKIEADILNDFEAMDEIRATRLRPKTAPLAGSVLEKMKDYKLKNQEMRAS